ncbi:hypothetical protein ORI99_00165 [Alishewanella sp. SMS9]|nr:hypothetical protein [Alishewanella sp. SMS9]
MDKMREEFDRAFGVVFEKIEMTADVAEKTRNTMLQLYSAGWHDSRAALVVESLPEEVQQFTDDAEYMNGYDSGYACALDLCKDALKKAGVRYE